MPRTRANDIFESSVGYADAAPILENQSNESDLAIELLTIPEAAKFLRVSPSGVRRLQQGRHVSFFKVGGSIRFAKRDLIAYLARQRIVSFGE